MGLREGFRSGLEEKVAAQLRAAGIDPRYEEDIIPYIRPARNAKYHPDFVLPNGIVIETKGRFVVADRQKHVLIKQQNPDLDIRFVFSNSRARISKGSPTTYAMWCTKNGFKFADKLIPSEWLSEPAK
ncbi:endodeoxyribonuclease [Ancylobacter aquaticus]|nr:endodeoxyribonuclease [Ancylobacter aquaticus]